MGFNEKVLDTLPRIGRDLNAWPNPNDFEIIHYNNTMFDKGYAFDMGVGEFIDKVKENFGIEIPENAIDLIPYSMTVSCTGKLIRLKSDLHKLLIEYIVFSPYIGDRKLVTLKSDHAAVVEKKKLIFNRGLLKNIIIPTRKVDGVFHFEEVVRVNTDEYGCLEFRFSSTEIARNFADSFRF